MQGEYVALAIAFLVITAKEKVPETALAVPLLTQPRKYALSGLVIRKRNKGLTYLQLTHLILCSPFHKPNSLLFLFTSLCAHRFYLWRKCKIECLCNDHMIPFHCAAASVLCQANITMQLTETQTIFSYRRINDNPVKWLLNYI